MKLARTPPKFEPTKRVYRNKLYALEKIDYRQQKYYIVVSPKAFRFGYFPHVDLLGEYLPSRNDLFILDIQGFFSLERELPFGTDLKETMERKGIYKAYLVEKEAGAVKGEQAGMLGVSSKYVEHKRPWTPGQIGFESYDKYIEAMDRKYSLVELKELCRQRGLSASGDKKTLVRRLF